jgi:hypothetical protein
MRKSYLYTFFLILFASNFFFPKSVVEFNFEQGRAPAAATIDCVQLVGNILAESRPKLTFPKNSLFARFPVLLEELQKLEFTPFQLNSFTTEYLKKYNRAPTLREAMEAMYAERRDLIGRYDEVIADVEALQNPALVNFIEELKFSKDKLNKFKDLDHYDDELVSSFNDGKSKFSSIDIPITMKNNVIETKFNTYIKERSREGNFNGELGELTAYGASKDKPIRKGLKFETRQLTNPIPYQLVIDEAIKKLEKSLSKKSDQQIIKLVNSYGEGILRNAKSYLDNLGERPIDRDILIGKIITMIRTKEIDLVFEKPNGTIVWAEVKAYKKPITMDILNGGGYKAKPMAEQLLEHKALRDLLGFKDQVELRFISPTSAIAPDAKAYIESLGYEVIGAR